MSNEEAFKNKSKLNQKAKKWQTIKDKIFICFF